MEYSQEYFASLLGELNEIGIALSSEHDHNRLLEYIVEASMRMTAADGGTLYLMNENKALEFSILHNRSLGEYKGGTSGEDIGLEPISLYDQDGKPNEHMVSAAAALSRETVNIADAYTTERYDFSGMRRIDQQKEYRSTSFLTVPMTNHEQEVIGVLQLINALDQETGEVIPFGPLQQKLVESLASQAAVSITNKLLIAAQKDMFDSLIKLIANAIDAKSPYTAGHCRRVPVITRLLADAASGADYGPLRDFTMTEEEKYELDVAAWLHDCGKITTPEFVVDKATKLQTIFDRLQWVQDRFELSKYQLLVEALLAKLDGVGGLAELLSGEPDLLRSMEQLDRDLAHVRRCNTGSETMTAQQKEHLRQIAGHSWRTVSGEQHPVLRPDELDNLLIERGTLNSEEREIINNHVAVTIKMLESLPYPRHLRRVPEYAGGHHEKMDGTGYPRQLKGEQMSVPARMLAIADVFEALTAPDRPYKRAMPLSQALSILRGMKDVGHIDPDLFEIFVREKVYREYAAQHLAEGQCDAIDEQALLDAVNAQGVQAGG